MSDPSIDDLASGLAEFDEPKKVEGRSALEQRVLAGFEEILRFVDRHGREPERGAARDIFERLYAVRLERIRASGECRAILKDVNHRGLLDIAIAAESTADAEPDFDALADSLADLGAEDDEISKLVHIRSSDERKAAEDIARRAPCPDFETYRPIFDQVQSDLTAGRRKTMRFLGNANVEKGDLFILEGQIVYVADAGEVAMKDYGSNDRRLHVIFDNGTESRPFQRSLQRAMYNEERNRRILPMDDDERPTLFK